MQELSSSVWFKLGYITTLQMQLFNWGKMIYTILAIVTNSVDEKKIDSNNRPTRGFLYH